MRKVQCSGDSEEGVRTLKWGDQKMHHKAGRRWVHFFLFALVGDEVKGMGIRGRGQ